MPSELLSKWWEPATGWWQIALMRAMSAGIWISIAVELIERIQGGNLPRIIITAGMLCWASALTVGPQCWHIFDTLPGSNSRKALTLIALFGFLLQTSGLIARYAA